MKLDMFQITLIKIKSNLSLIQIRLKPEIEKIHKELGVKQYVRMKSSLKFCVIAAGEYDGYVAEARACEWDIAAGHAILEHAGGNMSQTLNNKEIKYGKKDFKNPSLILTGKKYLVMDEQIRIISIIIVSVSIFGLLSFCICQKLH